MERIGYRNIKASDIPQLVSASLATERNIDESRGDGLGDVFFARKFRGPGVLKAYVKEMKRIKSSQEKSQQDI